MNKETENGTELSAVANTPVQKNAPADGKQKENIFIKIKKFFAFFTVEPYLMLYILPSIIATYAVQKLNLEKACRADLGQTQTLCDEIISGISNNTIVSNEAQKLVADLTAWKTPLQTGLPAITILFMGAWSDRTGNRKVLMVLPLIAEFISCFGLMFATYKFTEWPLWVTGVIEGLPSAILGGFSISLMGSFSYISDITTVQERTFRLGITGVIVTLGIPLATAVSGLLVITIGYYGIFGMAMVFYVIGFLYVMIRIRDVKQTETEGTFLMRVLEFFHPRNLVSTFSLLLPKNTFFKKLCLVLIAHIIIVGPLSGEGPVLFLYLLTKYKMNISDYSLFATYSVIVGLIGTTIGVTVFSKKMQMHDAVLGSIATICKVMGCVMYALAPTRGWFYVGPVLDLFGNLGTIAIRSIGSKVVKEDQIGKMGSIIGFVEAIIPSIYTPLYTQVYKATLATFSGAFYMLGGIMTLPALFIFIYLYMCHKKEQADIVKDPTAKEKYAHDNDITAL